MYDSAAMIALTRAVLDPPAGAAAAGRAEPVARHVAHPRRRHGARPHPARLRRHDGAARPLRRALVPRAAAAPAAGAPRRLSAGAGDADARSRVRRARLVVRQVGAPSAARRSRRIWSTRSAPSSASTSSPATRAPRRRSSAPRWPSDPPERAPGHASAGRPPASSVRIVDDAAPAAAGRTSRAASRCARRRRCAATGAVPEETARALDDDGLAVHRGHGLPRRRTATCT